MYASWLVSEKGKAEAIRDAACTYYIQQEAAHAAGSYARLHHVRRRRYGCRRHELSIASILLGFGKPPDTTGDY